MDVHQCFVLHADADHPDQIEGRSGVKIKRLSSFLLTQARRSHSESEWDFYISETKHLYSQQLSQTDKRYRQTEIGRTHDWRLCIMVMLSPSLVTDPRLPDQRHCRSNGLAYGPLDVSNRYHWPAVYRCGNKAQVRLRPGPVVLSRRTCPSKKELVLCLGQCQGRNICLSLSHISFASILLSALMKEADI